MPCDFTFFNPDAEHHRRNGRSDVPLRQIFSNRGLHNPREHGGHGSPEDGDMSAKLRQNVHKLRGRRRGLGRDEKPRRPRGHEEAREGGSRLVLPSGMEHVHHHHHLLPLPCLGQDQDQREFAAFALCLHAKDLFARPRRVEVRDSLRVGSSAGNLKTFVCIKEIAFTQILTSKLVFLLKKLRF